MRSLRPLLVVALLAPCLSCGEDCEDRLEVWMPVTDGDFVFEGTADGRPFRCAWSAEWWGGDGELVAGGACTGAADFRGASSPRAVFDWAPAAIEWDLTRTARLDPAGETTRTGRLVPAYDTGGACRTAEVRFL